MNHPHIPNRLPPNLCASQNYMEAKLPSENYFYWQLATASCDFLPVLQKFSNHSVQDCSWWAGGLWLWKQNWFLPLWMCFYSVSCERTYTTCYSSRAWEHAQKTLKTKKTPPALYEAHLSCKLYRATLEGPCTVPGKRHPSCLLSTL